MKVSLNWLREFVALPPTTAGTRRSPDPGWRRGRGGPPRAARTSRNVVVAQILESAQHPNADRLSVCKVDAGNGQTLQIVCGAKNYRVGDKVPLALPGAVLPGDFKIKVGKLRGVDSQGMMCSAKELGLGEGHEGLLILPPDAPLGAPDLRALPRGRHPRPRDHPQSPRPPLPLRHRPRDRRPPLRAARSRCLWVRIGPMSPIITAASASPSTPKPSAPSTPPAASAA